MALFTVKPMKIDHVIGHEPGKCISKCFMYNYVAFGARVIESSEGFLGVLERLYLSMT